MSNNRRLREIQQIYNLLPRINCTGECWEDCRGIDMSFTERHALRKATGKTVEALEPDEMCPVLDTETHRCTGYKARPMICRIYGLSEALRCPKGCLPDRELSDKELIMLQTMVLYVSGDMSREEFLLHKEMMEDPRMMQIISFKLRGRMTPKHYAEAVNIYRKGLGL